ncbi:hypothetical protein [Trichodesmium erythraeum]|uniref:hypothetical protein n=1 Tax=Trichodesmium erythraeum TaxID=1206 RepID=UPI00003C9FB9
MICLYLVSKFEQCHKAILYYPQTLLHEGSDGESHRPEDDRIINFHIEITEKIESSLSILLTIIVYKKRFYQGFLHRI